MSYLIYVDRWNQRRDAYEAIRDKGECHLSQHRRRLQVVSPYNDDFAAFASSIGGNWRAKSGIWSFRIQSLRIVYARARAIFGPRKVVLLGGLSIPPKKGITVGTTKRER